MSTPRKTAARKKPKTVEVEIRASQKIHFLQTVNMEREDLDRLRKLTAAGDEREACRLRAQLAESYLDPHDEFDYEDFDGDEVEIVLAKKGGGS